MGSVMVMKLTPMADSSQQGIPCRRNSQDQTDFSTVGQLPSGQLLPHTWTDYNNTGIVFIKDCLKIFISPATVTSLNMSLFLFSAVFCFLSRFSYAYYSELYLCKRCI